MNYAEAAQGFNFDQAASSLLSGSTQALNACFECCDRHVDHDKVALYWENSDGDKLIYSFAELQRRASQFANFLKSQGVKKGDRISGLLPRTPELLITILGTWRIGAVYQPLFTAFGPKAIEHRLRLANSKWVVTDLNNRSKLNEIADCPNVLSVAPASYALADKDLNFWQQIEQQSAQCEIELLTIEDPFLLMSTSGTTGPAKTLAVPLKAIIAFGRYMVDTVGLRSDDRFWNIADPGWAYGLYYGIVGPLLIGHSILFYDGGFSIPSLKHIVKSYDINNLIGAPTAYRMMMAADATETESLGGQFRVVSSAGEPLNPEVIRWFKQALDVSIYDHYGQTEVGMVVCNHHELSHEFKAGSAGFATSGYRVVIVNEQGEELPTDQVGILAVDMSQSPMMWFRGYEQSSKSPFVGHYYLTGDSAEIHANGSMSFVGRNDDVITTSGYRIGPFDVESALLEHDAVIEAAVIGVPDPERTEIIKAFVILANQVQGTAQLAQELSLFVKQRLSAHAYPREIEFVEELPKTPSGKIQRFLLRQNEIEKLKHKQPSKHG